MKFGKRYIKIMKHLRKKTLKFEPIMNWQRMIRILLIFTLLQSSVSIYAVDFSSFKIHLRGLGPIQINDTLPQLEKKLSRKLVGGKETDYDGYECHFYSIFGLSGISLMFSGKTNNLKLSRIYISNLNFQTISGIKINSEIASVLSVYKGNIKREKEHYTGDTMLIFEPKDLADKDFRIIFLTNNKKVTEISVGRIPEIFAVEGCD
ncbi:hypothetical protein [Leptospira santarosai]|uniref:hypothetical protein n=1 Tax=Leptospira santarosai TaxID=28183 RepID=UPI0002BC28F6|nr:hypothetical protein [Leptospira santarosai]EMF89288.1 hypothetical protein LEP1GSC005_1388 [Leptospira santarosai str. ST188]EMJ46918.1 hypothetical protein LEP1GSC169_0846 [Leptospira santarosai str. HAI1349]EMO72486.1 hypothetical protein LEP1GSC130_0001 [Leptospira santarosai str. 200403458]EMO98260.1 hypothetical protein LEP1GSC120_0691 [Leptospira santarosai str. 200702252]EMP04308.1 hypothetical protein LEP1GSC171_0287 [Leptospira santarosai str. HAI1380]